MLSFVIACVFCSPQAAKAASGELKQLLEAQGLTLIQ
jgi:hypothetical protein